jgi:AbrB family looped-hinge helix DNA binding protein
MKTRLSSRGQIVLPKVLRERHGWKEGTEVEVEEVEGGVILRFAPAPRPSSLDDLLGCSGYRGPRWTLEAMEERRRARGARSRGPAVIAIDTGVLVRVVTNDDPPQARRALRLMSSDRIFVSLAKRAVELRAQPPIVQP